ncbi:MAG TPA: FecR domain-containing protein [Acidimicrobiia bacterium]|nr:FecR domain-containing protein [Acidimicrobiia bacterium]
MRTRWWSAIALVALLALAACGGDDGSDVVSATLRVHDGLVEVDSGDGFAAGSNGQRLSEGTTVRTGSDGRASIEWFDGSVTRLDFGTTFRISTMQVLDGDGTVIESEQTTGNTYNRVAELTDAASRFAVETPTAIASVQGTTFAVLFNADGTVTYAVLEGTVLINGVEVNAGEMVTVDEEGNVSEPEPIPDGLIDDDWIVYNCELDGGPECPDGASTTTTVAGPEQPTTSTTSTSTSTTTTASTTTTTTPPPPPPPPPPTTTSTTVPATTTTTIGTGPTVPPTTTTSTTVPPTTTTTTVPPTTTTTTTVPAFSHVVISPSIATVEVGQSQEFTATAYDTQNEVIGDVTGQSTFSAGSPAACVGNLCSALETGLFTVTVLYNDTTDEATLNVVDIELGSGDVEVFLQWTGPADLDLHVEDPFECVVFYANTSCESGGVLQVDIIPGCSSSTTAIHVEQIFWPEGGAPAGAYRARADAWDVCGLSISWTMTIYVNGSLVHEVSGTFTSNTDLQDQNFTVPGID